MLELTPASRVLLQSSVFAQDDLAWKDGRLRLTIGSKLENNSYTGWETQPNVRGFISLSEHASLWMAASRAVRLPSRAESDGSLLQAVLPPDERSPLPQAIQLLHDSRPAKAEVLVNVEGGYRLRFAERVGLDAAVYRNRYRDLVDQGLPSQPDVRLTPVPHIVVPITFGNVGRADAAGLDLNASVRAGRGVRLTGGYAWYHRIAQAHSTASLRGHNTPNHQSHVRASLNLPRRVELDVTTRYVGRLHDAQVPAYVEADARVGFRAGHVDVAIVGRNLLSSSHAEYVPDVIHSLAGRVERSVSFHVVWTR